jgi:hypothetical protein
VKPSASFPGALRIGSQERESALARLQSIPLSDFPPPIWSGRNRHKGLAVFALCSPWSGAAHALPRRLRWCLKSIGHHPSPVLPQSPHSGSVAQDCSLFESQNGRRWHITARAELRGLRQLSKDQSVQSWRSSALALKQK